MTIWSSNPCSNKKNAFRVFLFERATGFAPVPKPWKGFVLLLHYARLRFAEANLRRGKARRKVCEGDLRYLFSCRGARTRTEIKSSQRTRAAVALRPAFGSPKRTFGVAKPAIRFAKATYLAETPAGVKAGLRSPKRPTVGKPGRPRFFLHYPIA